MTDQKKKTVKSGTEAKKKLQVSKETLKDLSAANKSDRVRGGMPAKPSAIDCPWCNTGATDN